MTRLINTVLLLSVYLCSAAYASLTIDEVLPYGGGTGREPAEQAKIKLSNTSGQAYNISGVIVTAGDTYLTNLPFLLAPAGCYIHIVLGSGTNELDPTDGEVTIYTGSQITLPQSSGVAIYQTFLGPQYLLDYVAWSNTGTAPADSSYQNAILAAKWTDGDYVDVSQFPGGASIARWIAGYDTDSSADWDILEFAPRMAQASATEQNPTQLLPASGILFGSGDVEFSFKTPSWAEQARLVIDDDQTFSSPLVNQVFNGPLGQNVTFSVSPDLADGEYYWRVDLKPAGQPFVTGSAVWVLFVHSGINNLNGFGLNDLGPNACNPINITKHAVTRLIQHKDSKLLCIWDQNAFNGGAPSNQNPLGRPGCDAVRFPGQHWDKEHAETAAHVQSCGHCAFYCARACITMINRNYAGDMLMDRVSYQARNGDIAGPEGDLGHDRGLSDAEVTNTLGWALSGAAVTYTPYFGATPKATFDQYKAALANGPLIAGVPNHVIVISGYLEIVEPNSCVVLQRFVWVDDPWPGAAVGWTEFTRWVARNDATWTLAAGNKVGRKQEAAMTTDTDGDGVMDFDEGQPRPFCSVHNKKDTEGDDLPDKIEIEAYTYHEERHHNTHDNDAAPPGFADIDNDNLRSECDCDSENDSHFDGGEDINGDADGGMDFLETDMFGPEKSLRIFTDKTIYRPLEVVKLTGWNFHENSTYPYDLIVDCPVLADNAPLGHDGTVATNAFGRFPFTVIDTCIAPGTKKVVLDILRDNLYSTPDNLDPSTCYTCLGEPPITTTQLKDDVCFARYTFVPNNPIVINFAVVTGYALTGPPGFYVQDFDQPCGIRIISTASVFPGQLVSIEGVYQSSVFEPMIAANTVIPIEVFAEVKPIFIDARYLGGNPLPGLQPLIGTTGANNQGLLMQIVGIILPPDNPFPNPQDPVKIAKYLGDPDPIIINPGPVGFYLRLVPPYSRVMIAGHVGEFNGRPTIRPRDYFDIMQYTPPVNDKGGIIRGF